MRKLGLLIGLLLVGLVDVGTATAQEMNATVDLKGCLAAENEGGEAEYLLEDVADSDASEIELMAAEGVNLAPHVGHTVEIHGTVVGDDDEGMEDDDGAEMSEDAEQAQEAEGMDEDGDLHVKVTKLTHLAASCEEN